MTMQNGQDQQRKFEELILFVSRKTESDLRCGKTKLNKILFYSDFTAFKKLGRSISGQTYQKLAHGPAPKGFVPTVENMVREQLCLWVDRDHYGRAQQKLIARREPDLTLFSAEELDLVSQIIADLWPLNAKEVSDLSHEFIGWRLAEEREEIPYFSVYVGEPQALTAEELEWAEEVIREHLAEQAAAGR